MNDDDQVIIDCLQDIKQGIQNGEWVDVCKGYNGITGESLEPPQDSDVDYDPPKPSKLQKIREHFSQNQNENNDFEQEESVEEYQPINWGSMTIKNILQTLEDQFGISDISYDKKADLVEKAKEIEKTHMPEQTVIKNEGGMQVISTPPDPEEAKINERKHKSNPDANLKPAKRNTEFDKTFGKYDATDDELSQGRKTFRFRSGLPNRRQ